MAALNRPYGVSKWRSTPSDFTETAASGPGIGRAFRYCQAISPDGWWRRICSPGEGADPAPVSLRWRNFSLNRRESLFGFTPCKV